MYQYEDILEEKLIILKEYLSLKGLSCEKVLNRDYLIKIRVNNKGEFNLYYKPKKNKFTIVNQNLDNEVLGDIEEFIDSGWNLNQHDLETIKYNELEIKKDIEEENSTIQINDINETEIKLDNKTRKNILNLKKVYEVISKYKNCNIEFEDLIKAINKVCNEEERKILINDDVTFTQLEGITLRYIS